MNKTRTSSHRERPRGFSLVIAISMMVLLSMLAVGLLSLSTISLRQSSQGAAMAAARANARLALALAIGELQKNAGPDQRVTAPADLVDPSHPRGLTGVWKSWKPPATGVAPGDYSEHKEGEGFLGYLMSNPAPAAAPDPGSVPSGGERVELLAGKAGAANGSLEAPLVRTDSGTEGQSGAVAWVALDEGVKSRIDLEPEERNAVLSEQVVRLGSPARNRFAGVKGLEFLEPGGNEDDLRVALPKLVSLKEVEIESGSPGLLTDYQHDFTVHSTSLQTDTADGGLKTDLSVTFEGNYKGQLPRAFAGRYLYSDSTTPFMGSHSDPRWDFYANFARLYRRADGAFGNTLNGINASRPGGWQLATLNSRVGRDRFRFYEPEMGALDEPVLMPTVIRVDMMFSLVVRNAHQGRGTSAYPYMLHLMYLPVVTLHNPYNVPLRCNGLSVEFSDVPVGFQFLVNGQPANSDGRLIPINDLYVNGSRKKTFSVTLSNSLTRDQAVEMGPGETLIFGTPFSKDASWTTELQRNGDVMFDWRNDNLTSAARMIPGMITGPNDGIGYDVDWLAPNPRAPWVNQRRNEGVLLVGPNDRITVRFGPVVPSSANGAFEITTRMANRPFGNTQVYYSDATTLDRVLSEGVSPRFPQKRAFPADFPAPGSPPMGTRNLLEADSRRFRDYVNARPFAVFSVGAKTTVESFTMGRPVTDNGLAFPMASCSFAGASSQGSSPLEFALVPVDNGSAAVESDGPKGFFFGGHGSTNGSTSATLYELPVAPLQSIAQLRHANAASLGASPMVTYSVGESRAHPALPADAIFEETAARTVLLDHSWLANSTLWDGYWFSSLASLDGPAFSGGSSRSQSQLAERFFAGEEALPNPRNIPYFPSGGPAATNEVAKEVVDGEGRNTAAYVLTEGGFNVNSTSVAAWTSVLSALTEGEVPLFDGSTEVSAGVPFPRVRRTVRGWQSADATPKEKLWNSYRSLEPGEVRELAEEIVKEVRTRGPFLSMAEFVNRRIGPADELSRAGAIQSAIDRLAVNGIMESNARPVTPADVAGYGWENPEAVTGNTGAGAPGEVSQGDVLSAIGSFVSVRSDTFRIRAYGDARNASGKVVATAWCEAVVQRFPEYVDGADRPEDPATTDANVRFGRRFRVVSFRWLAKDEV